MNRLGVFSAFWTLLLGVGSAFGQAEKASLEGIVMDGATRQPIAGAQVNVYRGGGAGQVVQTKSTSFDGTFRLSLSAKELYQVIVLSKGYMNSIESLDFSDPRVTSRVGKTFYLTKEILNTPAPSPSVVSIPPPAKTAPQIRPEPKPVPEVVVVAKATPRKPEPVAVTPPPTRKPAATPPPPIVTAPKPPLTISERPVEIRPIFFAQSTADVLPESRESLDMLVRFLATNPNITVELTGHTDNQGDFDQNVALSKQRADVVRNYVLSKGIVPQQIRTRGYGATRPAVTNNYETKRPLNRRVEITIVKE